MSIATEISRIQTDRNKIRAKLVELGMATNTDKLDTLATSLENMENQGAVSANVKEGETYTIPKGYHNGSGTVSGVAGGGNYTLQSKTATPTKKQQNVTPDAGYYGLSDVTVEPIPDAYQDVTSVTATAADVLTSKVYVDAEGTVTTGTMANNGAVSKTLDTSTTSYTVPKGYHSGTGTVKITTETKTIEPTKEEQTVSPASGKVLSKVVVSAIPDAYQDVTGVTATAAGVLGGTSFVNAAGETVEGTMGYHSDVEEVLDANSTSYTIPEGYHDGEGTVSITTQEKTVTPTKSAQAIAPDTGKVLSKVNVAAIPDAYQDVSSVNVTADLVLSGQVFVDSTGAVVTGTMPVNNTGTVTLDSSTTSYTIPKGFHGGTGKVQLVTETKSVTPTKSAQTITPSSGKVLSEVSVAAIPDNYIDTSDATATYSDILVGKSAYVNGKLIDGSMPYNGEITATIDGLTSTSYTIPPGATTGGTVSLSSDIEEALAAI